MVCLGVFVSPSRISRANLPLAGWGISSGFKIRYSAGMECLLILRQPDAAKLELGQRLPEIAIAEAQVLFRRGAGTTPQHPLVVHEFGIILHQSGGERLITGVRFVMIRGPDPEI